MLTVSADQIHSFNGRGGDFADLLRQLLYVEAFTHDLALGGIYVTAQITVADGGEDGRIEWRDGRERTDYLPTRFTLFQIKATTMPKAKCKNEVTDGHTRAPKPAIEEVALRSGTYVVFGTDICSPPMLRDRVDGLKEGVRSARNTASVDFYDANKIAGWVNRFPSVQAWVHERTSGSSIYGLQSREIVGPKPPTSR